SHNYSSGRFTMQSTNLQRITCVGQPTDRVPRGSRPSTSFSSMDLPGSCLRSSQDSSIIRFAKLSGSHITLRRSSFHARRLIALPRKSTLPSYVRVQVDSRDEAQSLTGKEAIIFFVIF
ncbi:hypothetical protein PMAYCL1PPCAC_03133, partial [Pristionchus mayeri]